ncbi:protein tis11 [Anaeramoeba flamelloides]|uniref:Protein tis11 n=1 Tax=Anaeramoeba flamelloides TaxID=1746091 RepID=A0AAV7ZLI8_9EUKA|nr:protein tis11 [Anaeramoeba flamelloides]
MFYDQTYNQQFLNPNSFVIYESNKENLHPQFNHVNNYSQFSPNKQTNPKQVFQNTTKRSPRSTRSPLRQLNRNQSRHISPYKSPGNYQKKKELKKLLKYKTEICKNYHGEGCCCFFGHKCNYIHNKESPEAIALSSIHTLKKMGIYRLVRRSKLKIRLSVFESLSKKQKGQKNQKKPLKQI